MLFKNLLRTLFTLVVLVTASVSMFASSIIIGSGTSTSNTYVINRNFNYSNSQMIFTAAEIGATGPVNISKIAFNKGGGSTSSDQIQNLRVFIRSTTDASYAASSTLDSAGFTQVFSGAITIPAGTNGWVDIPFSSFFAYDGTSNIEILVMHGYQSYISSTLAPQWVYSTYTGVNKCKYKNYDSKPATVTMAVSTIRPNIRFNIPEAMVYSSTEVKQLSNSAVKPGDLNAGILSVNVKTIGELTPLTAGALAFNLNGTSNVSNISNAKLFYNTTESLVGAVAIDSLSISSGVTSLAFAATKTLAEGNNYFILAYDVKSDATVGEFLDAGFDSLTVAGNAQVLNSSPAGNRKIKAALAGKVFVGGVDYPTLSELTTDINELGLGANLEVEIIADINQTIPAVINQWNEVNGSGYTLTIHPDASPRRIYGTLPTNGVIVLNGADRVIINGSTSGSGTDKILTIENQTTTDGAAVWIKSLGVGLGATNNTIKNCLIVNGNFSNSSAYGILASGATYSTTSASSSSDSIVVMGNEFSKSYGGLRIYGPSDVLLSGIVVKNNIFGHKDSVNQINYYGAYIYGCAGALIDNNQFANIQNTAAYISSAQGTIVSNNSVFQSTMSLSWRTATGINCASDSVSIVNNSIKNFGNYGLNIGGIACNIDGNLIAESNDNLYSTKYGINYVIYSTSSFKITNNIIRDINNTKTDGEVNGMYIKTGMSNTDTVNVNNNMISGLTNNASSTKYVSGIKFYYGIKVNFFNNTINLSGNLNNPTNNGASTCLYLNNGEMYVKNNIFRNALVAGSTSNCFAIISDAAGIIKTASNNVYDYTGASNGKMAKVLSTVHADYTAWKTVVTADAASKEASVTLASPVPYLDGSSIGSSVLTATELLVAKDINGETRTNDNNTIGADIAVPTSVKIGQNLPKLIDGCAGLLTSFNFVPQIAAFADGIVRTPAPGDLPSMTYEWYKNDTLIAYDATKSNEENNYIKLERNSITFDPTRDFHTGTYHATVTFNGVSAYTDTLTMRLKEKLAVKEQPVGFSACITDPYKTVSLKANGTIVKYRWEKFDVESSKYITFIETLTPTINLPVAGSLSAAGKYRAVIVGDGSCGDLELASEDFNVSVFDTLSNVFVSSSTGSAPYACVGAKVTLSANAKGVATSYKWQIQRSGIWADINVYENATGANKDFVIDYAKVENTSKYRVIVSSAIECNKSVIAEYDLRILDTYKTIQDPNSSTVCKNETIYLGYVGDGEVLEYQWYKDGVALDAKLNKTAAQPFLIIPNADFENSGEYLMKVKVKECSGERYVVSKPANVYVMGKTEITRQPSTVKAKIGGNAAFVVEVQHKGIVPPFYKEKFQWFRYDATNRKVITLTDNANVGGSSASVLRLTNINANDFTNAGDYYFVEITGQCGVVKSGNVNLNEGGDVVVITNPLNVQVCENASAEFTVDAQATIPTGVISYQWTKDGKDISDDANVTGSTTNKLSIAKTTVANLGDYAVRLSLEDVTKVTSSANLNLNFAPVIKTQPEATVTVTKDKDFKISVKATDAVSYQWSKDGKEITGETKEELSRVKAETTDAGKYTVKITNACGDVVSNESIVTVSKEQASGVNDDNTDMQLSVVPNPVNEGASLSFYSAKGGYAKISVIDLAGRELMVVFEGNANGGLNKARIDASNLSNGTYFIKCLVEGSLVTKQIAIVK